MERLPLSPMPWNPTDIQPLSGTLLAPATLYHRNPLDCIRSLLARPSLKDHLEYVPRRSWEDSERDVRIYSEIMTGDWAWETQVSWLSPLM
jgi:hypothetical protein